MQDQRSAYQVPGTYRRIIAPIMQESGMAKKYLIGVDLGTSGTKAALYQIDGKKIAESSVEVPLYYPKPGMVEQECGDFYDSARRTVRSCIEQSGIDPQEVAAIAFDSQMAGVGLIDQDFQPVSALRLVAGRALPALYRVDGQGSRRPDHPANRLPADHRPRPEDAVVEV